MSGEPSRIRENCSAFNVIPMAVAVDDIPHRHFEALGELLFHPRRKGGIDGIGEDDAFRRHHEQRKIVVVACPVNVSLDVDDLADRRALRLLRRQQARKQTKRENRDERSFHMRKDTCES